MFLITLQLTCALCKTLENVTSKDEYESSDFNPQHYPKQHHVFMSAVGIAIPGSWIPDRFPIPKSRDYERPNPGILGVENNVLSLLLHVKCMH